MKTLLTVLAALSATAMIATAADEAKPEGKKPNPEARFKKLDADNDNAVTLEEFKAKAKDPAKAETAFGKRDKNGDGKLSLEEFSAGGKKKES
jgi:hypothetical protein